MRTRSVGVILEAEVAMEFVRLLEGTGVDWFRNQTSACQWAILDEMEDVLAVIDLALIELRGNAKGTGDG